LVRHCEKYPAASKFFSDPTDCQSSLLEAIKIIEEAINIKTSRAKSLCGCEVVNRINSKIMMKLEASQEIIEVKYDDFSRIIGYYEQGIAGSYHPKTGKIFLIEGEWCFSNLIHEALHSRSAFSKITPPQKNLEFVSDGLTELILGLVLKRSIPPCYEKWQIVNSCFLSPYEKFVKPWYYLTFKVDFKPIVLLYFDVKERNPLEKLGELLQELLGSEFKNIFLKYNPDERGLFDRFKDQLGRIFPVDFASFRLAATSLIDLPSLIIDQVILTVSPFFCSTLFLRFRPLFVDPEHDVLA